MKTKIPKKLINTKYRKIMWENYVKIIRLINKDIPISSAYLVGSFASNKKRPSDVDLLLLMKTKKQIREKWAVDLEIVPDNEFGEECLEDLEDWLKQKYGKKNSEVIKLK
jgi:predicted nucleotidyltransferase